MSMMASSASCSVSSSSVMRAEEECAKALDASYPIIFRLPREILSQSTHPSLEDLAKEHFLERRPESKDEEGQIVQDARRNSVSFNGKKIYDPAKGGMPTWIQAEESIIKMIGARAYSLLALCYSQNPSYFANRLVKEGIHINRTSVTHLPRVVFNLPHELVTNNIVIQGDEIRLTCKYLISDMCYLKANKRIICWTPDKRPLSAVVISYWQLKAEECAFEYVDGVIRVASHSALRFWKDLALGKVVSINPYVDWRKILDDAVYAGEDGSGSRYLSHLALLSNYPRDLEALRSKRNLVLKKIKQLKEDKARAKEVQRFYENEKGAMDELLAQKLMMAHAIEERLKFVSEKTRGVQILSDIIDVRTPEVEADLEAMQKRAETMNQCLRGELQGILGQIDELQKEQSQALELLQIQEKRVSLVSQKIEECRTIKANCKRDYELLVKQKAELEALYSLASDSPKRPAHHRESRSMQLSAQELALINNSASSQGAIDGLGAPLEASASSYSMSQASSQITGSPERRVALSNTPLSSPSRPKHRKSATSMFGSSQMDELATMAKNIEKEELFGIPESHADEEKSGSANNSPERAESSHSGKEEESASHSSAAAVSVVSPPVRKRRSAAPQNLQLQASVVLSSDLDNPFSPIIDLRRDIRGHSEHPSRSNSPVNGLLPQSRFPGEKFFNVSSTGTLLDQSRRGSLSSTRPSLGRRGSFSDVSTHMTSMQLSSQAMMRSRSQTRPSSPKARSFDTGALLNAIQRGWMIPQSGRLCERVTDDRSPSFQNVPTHTETAMRAPPKHERTFRLRQRDQSEGQYDSSSSASLSLASLTIRRATVTQQRAFQPLFRDASQSQCQSLRSSPSFDPSDLATMMCLTAEELTSHSFSSLDMGGIVRMIQVQSPEPSTTDLPRGRSRSSSCPNSPRGSLIGGALAMGRAPSDRSSGFSLGHTPRSRSQSLERLSTNAPLESSTAGESQSSSQGVERYPVPALDPSTEGETMTMSADLSALPVLSVSSSSAPLRARSRSLEDLYASIALMANRSTENRGSRTQSCVHSPVPSAETGTMLGSEVMYAEASSVKGDSSGSLIASRAFSLANPLKSEAVGVDDTSEEGMMMSAIREQTSVNMSSSKSDSDRRQEVLNRLAQRALGGSRRNSSSGATSPLLIRGDSSVPLPLPASARVHLKINASSRRGSGQSEVSTQVAPDMGALASPPPLAASSTVIYSQIASSSHFSVLQSHGSAGVSRESSFSSVVRSLMTDFGSVVRLVSCSEAEAHFSVVGDMSPAIAHLYSLSDGIFSFSVDLSNSRLSLYKPGHRTILVSSTMSGSDSSSAPRSVISQLGASATLASTNLLS